MEAGSAPKPTSRVVEKEKEYQVVWPQSKWGKSVVPLAHRVDTLNGQTIAEIATLFDCDKIYATLEKLLLEQYPGIKKFIPATEFAGVELTGLGEALKASGATLAITGCGC